MIVFFDNFLSFYELIYLFINLCVIKQFIASIPWPIFSLNPNYTNINFTMDKQTQFYLFYTTIGMVMHSIHVYRVWQYANSYWRRQHCLTPLNMQFIKQKLYYQHYLVYWLNIYSFWSMYCPYRSSVMHQVSWRSNFVSSDILLYLASYSPARHYGQEKNIVCFL